MDFIPTAALAGLVIKFLDFLKGLTNRDWNAVVTQLTGWAAGVAGIFLAGATTFASEIQIGDRTLQSLNGSSKLFVGLLVSSVASVIYDYKKARDNNDSAKQPPLLPPPSA